MRKKNARPLPRLHKRSGNARVRIGGREYWLGKHGSPEAEARYNALLAEHEAGTKAPRVQEPPPVEAAPPARITIAELAVAWLKDIQRTKGDAYRGTSTWQNAVVAARMLQPVAAMPAHKLKPSVLIRLREQFAAEPVVGTDRPRSRRYVNDITARVVMLYRWAVLRDMVPPDVLTALQLLPGLKSGELATVRESERRKPVQADHIEAVLEHLPEPLRPLVRFLHATGCRPGEAVGMRVEHIADRDARVWQYTPPKHKNAWRGQTRTIAVGPRAQAAIRDALGGRTTGIVFAKRCPRNVVQLEPAGYTVSAVRVAIARACEAAGVPKWVTYRLRNTRAQDVRDTAGADAALAVLGDRTSRVLDVYTQASHTLAVDAALAGG